MRRAPCQLLDGIAIVGSIGASLAGTIGSRLQWGRSWCGAQLRRLPSQVVQKNSYSRLEGTVMIGVFVIFYYGDKFDEEGVRKIAETARTRFEGMAGLRSKAFTLNPGKREATNFYVWDSEEAARAFFTEALLERVTTLYGVRPIIEFVQIAELVENPRT